ncbi:MAG: HD domain-containing protein [Desulfobacterota bacterium]|nr:HD domain-containing protein [Thermodesulfobacteriota bacterium]
MFQDVLTYFLNNLGSLYRMRRIYPQGSKQVLQTAKQAHQRLSEWGKPVRITLLGQDLILEDRRIDPIPATFQALFQALQQLGFERIQIDAEAQVEDLLDWIEHIFSKQRTPYQSSKILTGWMNLQHRTSPQSLFTRSIMGYLGFLAETQGILTDLEARKPEGIVRAREVVCTIVSRLTIVRELFEPIRELKNFDDYTYTHALNVCILSSALARALRFNEEVVNTVAMAGLCHDLGKKEVPKEILNQKGTLRSEDWKLMEKHPYWGAKLLLEIPNVEANHPLLPVVAFQHHMGYDQSGYPKVQPRMPFYPLHIASQLVAISDVYDALRTVRPYRPALSVEKAATFLIRDAWSGKLNREFVSAFLLLLNVLSAGRRVVLSDGTRGRIVEAHSDRPLCPMIGDEQGRIFDLSDPAAPRIWEIEEEVAEGDQPN